MAGRDEGTPVEALRMAGQFVAMMRRKGVLLDYTPDSLALVDAALDQVKSTGVSAQDASGMIYAIGCYAGEVLVRNAKAQGRPTAEMGMSQVCSWSLVVALPSGAGLNPIGKAFKRFNNGAADSLAFFWQASHKL